MCIFDHCPIWLKASSRDWGPKPFKHFKCWFDHEEFIPFVEGIWYNTLSWGIAVFILTEKMKIPKAKCKFCNKEVFGITDLKVEKADSVLNSLDSFVTNTYGGVEFGGV